MRKLSFFVAMMLMCVIAMAQIQDAVNVHLLNGSVSSTKFDEFHKFVVAGDNLILLRVSGEASTIAMDDIQKITFGPYQETNSVDNVELVDINVYQSGDNCVILCDEAIRSIMLFDLSGRILHNNSSVDNVYEYTVSVANLVNGVYLITVETERGATTQKVVVK